MNRLLVGAGIVLAAVIVLHRLPTTPPAIVTEPMPRAGERQRRHRAPEAPSLLVYVVGAVARPGLYRLTDGARVNDAVELAHGFTEQADPAAVNLAERVSDGEEIDVLRKGEAPLPRSRARSARSRGPRTPRKRRSALAPGTQIDLNAADAQALGSLPGVGPALAARIVEYREVNGPFASVDELADVGGVTQRVVDAISPFLIVRNTP
jgi:competence protein ComEA